MKASAFLTRASTSARGAPRRRRPKATLSKTLSQKKLASCWNTAPMPVGTVPLSALPSNVTVPAVAAVMPDNRSSSVDLPQPEGPTTVKNSPRVTSRSIGPSACTSGCPSWPRNTLVTPRRLIWVAALSSMPHPPLYNLQADVDRARKDEDQKCQRQNVGDVVDTHGAHQGKPDARGRSEQLTDQRA